MTLGEVLTFMKENPNVKIWMPKHYRDWEYNYYDKKTNRYLTDSGKEWDIDLSIHYNEIDNYALYNNGER